MTANPRKEPIIATSPINPVEAEITRHGLGDMSVRLRIPGTVTLTRDAVGRTIVDFNISLSELEELGARFEQEVEREQNLTKTKTAAAPAPASRSTRSSSVAAQAAKKRSR